MKKCLLIAAVSLLCLLMVGSVIFTALSLADDSVFGDGKHLSYEPLADAEAPTFNTTTPYSSTISPPTSWKAPLPTVTT